MLRSTKAHGIVIVDGETDERLYEHNSNKLSACVQYEAFHHQPQSAAFVEAALIVEAGLDKKLDGVVVVWCEPEQQIERLMLRRLRAKVGQRHSSVASVEDIFARSMAPA